MGPSWLSRQTLLVVIWLCGSGSVVVTGCDIWEFQCLNGVCVKGNARCDGKQHCNDLSDEMNCPTVYPSPPTGGGIPCVAGRFQCDNGQCIYNRWRCDGEDDCGDSSDEFSCSDDKEQGGMKMGSIVGLGIAMAGLAAVVAAITAMFLCLHSKRLHEATARRRRAAIQQVAGPGDHLPAYVIGNNALMREPPPRYSSRPDLSAVNLGFTGDGPLSQPPPYYSSNPNINSMSFATIEPPPSYSSRIDLSNLEDGNVNVSQTESNASSRSSNNLHNRTMSVSSRATLNDSLGFSRITLSNISGEPSNTEDSKSSLSSKATAHHDDSGDTQFRYTSMVSVSDLIKEGNFMRSLATTERRQLIRNRMDSIRIQRSASTPHLVFDITQGPALGGGSPLETAEVHSHVSPLARSRKEADLTEPRRPRLRSSSDGPLSDLPPAKSPKEETSRRFINKYKRNPKGLADDARHKSRSSTTLGYENGAFEPEDPHQSTGGIGLNRLQFKRTGSMDCSIKEETNEQFPERHTSPTCSDLHRRDFDQNRHRVAPPGIGNSRQMSKSLSVLASWDQTKGGPSGSYC